MATKNSQLRRFQSLIAFIIVMIMLFLPIAVLAEGDGSSSLTIITKDGLERANPQSSYTADVDVSVDTATNRLPLEAGIGITVKVTGITGSYENNGLDGLIIAMPGGLIINHYNTSAAVPGNSAKYDIIGEGVDYTGLYFGTYQILNSAGTGNAMHVVTTGPLNQRGSFPKVWSVTYNGSNLVMSAAQIPGRGDNGSRLAAGESIVLR